MMLSHVLGAHGSLGGHFLVFGLYKWSRFFFCVILKNQRRKPLWNLEAKSLMFLSEIFRLGNTLHKHLE